MKNLTVGQRFIEPERFINPNKHYIKVMAIVDGYVMARYKGCMPFVQGEKEFTKRVENFKEI
jgi:hypothetical protein